MYAIIRNGLKTNQGLSVDDDQNYVIFRQYRQVKIENVLACAQNNLPAVIGGSVMTNRQQFERPQ